MWVGQIKRGQAEGQFRADVDPKLAYRMIRDTIWVAVRWFRPDGPLGTAALADNFIAILFDGLAAGHRAGPRPPRPAAADDDAAAGRAGGAAGGRRPRQGRRDAGVHEVGDAVPRRARPGRARAALQRGVRRRTCLEPRAEWQRDGARRSGARPSTARSGTRRSSCPATASYRRCQTPRRAADVRGDDRHRRLVGLRGRPRVHRDRPAAARAIPDPMRPTHAGVEPLDADLWKRRTSIICQNQFKAGHRPRAAVRLHRAVASSDATSSPARRSAGRCASTPRPNPPEVIRYVDEQGHLRAEPPRGAEDLPVD